MKIVDLQAIIYEKLIILDEELIIPVEILKKIHAKNAKAGKHL